MTLDEAIERYTNNAEYERIHGCLQGCLDFRQLAEWLKDYKRLLEQEPCDDAISRQALDEIKELMTDINGDTVYVVRMSDIRKLPPVRPQETVTEFADRCRECGAKYGKLLKQKPKTGQCKDCKYFEYDKWLYINEIPVIIAHEICNKWAMGWKTKKDGFCFMFEPRESEDDECI